MIALMLSACVTTSPGSSEESSGPPSPVDSLTEETKWDRAVSIGLGTIIGAVGGAILAKQLGGDARTGALIGAGAGALVGGVAGEIIAERRKAYVTEQAYLDDEIAKTNVAIKTKQSDIQRARADLNQTRDEIDRLQTLQISSDAKAVEARKISGQLKTRLSHYNETLQNYQKSIDYLDGLIAAAPPPGENVAALEKQKAQLLERRNALEAQLRELYDLGKETEAQQKRVNSLTGT